jgi:phosphatidylglycerophosphatase A
MFFSVLSVSLFRYEGKDPGYIVIDEFAGICITMAGHSITLMNTIIGFFFFRIFDIIKPFPVKQAERLKGAWGIVADDVVAGLFASIILVVLGRFL